MLAEKERFSSHAMRGVAPRKYSRLGRVRVARSRYSLFAHSLGIASSAPGGACLAPSRAGPARFVARLRWQNKRTPCGVLLFWRRRSIASHVHNSPSLFYFVRMVRSFPCRHRIACIQATKSAVISVRSTAMTGPSGMINFVRPYSVPSFVQSVTLAPVGFVILRAELYNGVRIQFIIGIALGKGDSSLRCGVSLPNHAAKVIDNVVLKYFDIKRSFGIENLRILKH